MEINFSHDSQLRKFCAHSLFQVKYCTLKNKDAQRILSTLLLEKKLSSHLLCKNGEAPIK